MKEGTQATSCSKLTDSLPQRTRLPPFTGRIDMSRYFNFEHIKQGLSRKNSPHSSARVTAYNDVHLEQHSRRSESIALPFKVA